MNRAIDWVAFTRRGQVAAGLIEAALIALGLGLLATARHINRPTHTP